MKYLGIFILLLCWNINVFSQIKIEGKLVDKNSESIPYANIGILGKNIGTVSDENGEFKLFIESANLEDSLSFSFVGYELLTITIQEIISAKLKIFILKEKIEEIKEVLVIDKKPKIKKIGNKTHNPLLWGNLQCDNPEDILEFGQAIKLKNKNSYILSAYLFLQGVQGLDSVLFRINFYRFDEVPQEKIIEKSIIIKKKVEKSWIEFNLEDFDIILNQDFFIAYEILPPKENVKYEINYGGKLAGVNAFSRNNSLGNWQAFQGVGISTYVKVMQ